MCGIKAVRWIKYFTEGFEIPHIEHKTVLLLGFHF